MAEEQDNVSPDSGIPPQDVSDAVKKKRDTSRIDLADAEVPTDEEGGLTVRDVLQREKSETSRIDLETAKTPAPDENVELAKDATARIVLNPEGAPAPEPPPTEDKEGTARIVLSPQGRATPEEIQSMAKDATVRVDLTGLIEKGAGAAPAAGVPPRTVRLQRPTAVPPPKTVVLHRPEAAVPPPSAPKTVVLRHPDAPAEEDTKGTTSKIAVPEGLVSGAPTSQRKTIRIKRPDGAPSSVGSRLKLSSKPAIEAAEESDLEEQLETRPGAAWSMLALVAALVLCVVVYVLAAQTVAPTMPFPGRL